MNLQPSPTVSHSLPRLSLFEPQLAQNHPSWVKELKEKAVERYRTVGLPTPRLEEWRHTNVAALAQSPLVPWKEESAKRAGSEMAFLIEPWDGPRLVFVNGFFVPALSQLVKLPQGVAALTLSGFESAKAPSLENHLGRYAVVDRNFFTALNTAYFSDGLYLRIPKDAHPKFPLKLLYLTLGGGGSLMPMASPRHLVVLEEGSEATLVEEYSNEGKGTYFNNVVVEVALDRKAFFRHVRVQREGSEANHVSSVWVHQQEHSQYESHVFCLGGGLLRNELHVTLSGSHSRCTLNGLFMAGKEEHVDNCTVVEHVAPEAESSECYKGIVGGRATGVFNGRVIVKPGAQKSNAQQINRNLLVSDGATVSTRPQLEIYADDVRCSHGSATGSLDENSLFYLRSRGISKEESRQILVHAFAGEMVGIIPIEEIRRQISDIVQSTGWRIGEGISYESE